MDLIYIEYFLEYAGKLAILVALIEYLREIPQRKRQAELNAWQTINSAMNQRAASGRVEALEYLNEAGVDLNLLSVPDAYLMGTTKKGVPGGINLPGAKLRQANFAKSTLDVANFSNANLSGANLSGADLLQAYLVGANLCDANLSGANLQGAYLTKANLRGANLSGARLDGANLSGADLAYANLSGAELSGAELSGADLRGVDLRGAKYITSKQLCKAKTLYAAELDSGLRKEVKKECPEILAHPYR